MRPPTAFLVALLLLGGCQRRPAPEPMPSPFVLADAMQHWYGRYDTATQTARANLPEHPALDLTDSGFAPKDPVDITVIFDAAYTQAGHPRHVVVTAAVPHRSDKPGRPGDDLFHCLACRPVIGMAVFTLRKKAWLLESENAAVDLLGSDGAAPAVRLVTLGTDLHGIRLEGKTEALDFSSTTLSLLAPWRQQVVRAFTAETASSNRGACGPDSPLREACYGWQRVDTFTPAPGQEYDDLTLTSSGTQPAPETATPEMATTEIATPKTATRETATPRMATPKTTPQSATRPARGRGRMKDKGNAPPAPPPPTVIPVTGVERLRFCEGKYIPLPENAAPDAPPGANATH